MSEIFDRIYNDPALPRRPDMHTWQQPWEVDRELDMRAKQDSKELRSMPRPVGGVSLASRIKSLFK